MFLSDESRRLRWIGLSGLWLVALLHGVIYAVAVRENIALADRAGLRGAAAPTTPMQRICPAANADAMLWVRNALALSTGTGLRLRNTDADNAPVGREVHWSSGFAWLVLAGGHVRQWITGEPLARALEQSLAWFNLPLLCLTVAGYSWWVTRRVGLAAGILIGAAILGSDDFYATFAPNYVDHHGILAAAVLGLVLGVVFMGAGFCRRSDADGGLLPDEAQARTAARVSAIAGATGLWISAATLVPAIAVVGLSGALATLTAKRSAGGARAVPGLWRTWGRVGGLLSLAFYLLEYAPFHLGWRLEVNHPVYAAAWWGGAELIAALAEWRAGAAASHSWRRTGLALGAVLAAPAVLLVGGASVFVVADPFITALSGSVSEGFSIVKALRLFPAREFVSEFFWFGLAFVGGIVAWAKASPAERIVVVFAFLVSAALSMLAFAQIRWTASAAGPQFCLLVVALAVLSRGRRARFRWAIVALVGGLAAVPQATARVTRVIAANRANAIEPADGTEVVYRDLAAAIRASQPEGPVILLSSPNASAAIAYYGQFQAIGTLYWENLAGMKAAAAMLSAQSDLEARRLLRARAVTHVALLSEENFVAEYFQLIRGGEPGATLASSFGQGLLASQPAPAWAEVIPYSAPGDLPLALRRVVLLKTRFNRDVDPVFETGLEALAHGQLSAAEARIDEALARDPRNAEYWSGRARVLLAQGRMQPAADATSKAVEFGAPGQQSALCSLLAAQFQARGAPGAAAQLYRRALSYDADVATQVKFAWLLATCADAAVRNGAEALALTQTLVAEHATLGVLNVHAAALAENGRFDEAQQVAAFVLEKTREAGRTADVATAEARLLRYRAGAPWRE